MSTKLQSFEETGKNLTFKLKVRYEHNPTTLISTAKLISHDLRVKVKDVGLLFETRGKAWLIEQEELSDTKIISTILQQTTSKAWIAFEVVHDKDVLLEQTWVQVPRIERDMSIMLYPSYFIIAVLGFIELLLLKKTLIDQEVIILSKQDWNVILWISVAVVGWFMLVFYYVRKQTLHESYFQSIGLDYVSERNLDFYMVSKKLLGTKNITLRYTLSVTCYRGFFTHPDLPEKYPFKENRIDLNTIETVKHELKVAEGVYYSLIEQEYELAGEIDALNNELREAQILSLHAVEEEIEADHLSEQTKAIEDRKKELEQKKKEIAKRKEQAAKQVQKIRKEYFEMIKDVFEFDQTKVTEKELEEILYSNQLVAKLRAKISDLRNQLITVRQSEAGLYYTLAQEQETFNQRVADEAARRTNTTYSYQLVGTEEGDIPIPVSGAVSLPKKRSSILESDAIVTALIKLGVMGIFIGGLIYLINLLIDKAATINPWLAALIIFAFLILFIVLNRMINKIISYAQGSDITIKEAQ